MFRVASSILVVLWPVLAEVFLLSWWFRKVLAGTVHGLCTILRVLLRLLCSGNRVRSRMCSWLFSGSAGRVRRAGTLSVRPILLPLSLWGRCSGVFCYGVGVERVATMANGLRAYGPFEDDCDVEDSWHDGRFPAHNAFTDSVARGRNRADRGAERRSRLSRNSTEHSQYDYDYGYCCIAEHWTCGYCCRVEVRDTAGECCRYG